MKKIICILFALMLVISMAIPAFAVTPEIGVPDMPEIPDISDDVEIELPDGIFDDYIPDIDIDVELPEEPTEPPAEKPIRYNWCEMVKCWINWWRGKLPCI